MSYTYTCMKYSAALGLVFLGSVLALAAAEKQYQDATILSVEQKTNTRVLYYVVNTPITKDEPYYEVSLQLNDRVYVARYTPRHKDDDLPDSWVAGSLVRVRVHGRHVFIASASWAEVDLVITKSKASGPAKTSQQPAAVNR